MWNRQQNESPWFPIKHFVIISISVCSQLGWTMANHVDFQCSQVHKHQKKHSGISCIPTYMLCLFMVIKQLLGVAFIILVCCVNSKCVTDGFFLLKKKALLQLQVF